ncbi:MAG: tRNA (adenosine(37)-N6)-threonylcarbamoyltransferase complex dimerization subunit type 1 TsaB [Gammaproteobacteria bacterium]
MNQFRCLAIDTATEQPAVAACNGEQIAASQFGGARETEQIFSHVRHVLAETEQELGDLDCIAIGCGPGSFTGLRVGVAAAQSLAYGTDLPVCRLSSLAITAFGAGRRAGVSRVAVAFDARMGEVYAGYYEVGETGVDSLMADQVIAPEQLDLPGADSFIAVGPGWSAHPGMAKQFDSRVRSVDGEVYPAASDLLLMARPLFEAGETQPAATVLPQYLRDRVTG